MPLEAIVYLTALCSLASYEPLTNKDIIPAGCGRMTNMNREEWSHFAHQSNVSRYQTQNYMYDYNNIPPFVFQCFFLH